MAERLFYTMGEVAEMFDVNASLIRYWGTQFPQLKPHRNKKGNRLFTPADIEVLRRIYHYVKECGMTLEGAKRVMRGARAEQTDAATNMELLERLQSLRSMLVAVRDSITIEEDVPVVVAQPTPAPVPAPEPEQRREPEQPKRPQYVEQSLFDF